jgi:hypothetical protein
VIFNKFQEMYHINIMKEDKRKEVYCLLSTLKNRQLQMKMFSLHEQKGP